MAKVYAVLLRGVNVGGKNKLVMREFVQTLERLGASSVETIINTILAMCFLVSFPMF